jgi:hypothetical protein
LQQQLRGMGDNGHMERRPGAAAASEIPDSRGEAAVDQQGLLLAALSYAAAADAYVAQDPWYAPPPVLSLLARSMELVLKAYAVHHGASADALRYQLASDLEVSLRYALDRKLAAPGGVLEEDRMVIRELNAYQMNQRSGCPEVTSSRLPCTAVARGLLDRLLHGCCVASWGAAAYRNKLAAGRTPGLTIDIRSIYRLNDAPERREPCRVHDELAD